MTYTIAQTKTTPFAEFRDGYILVMGKSFPFEKPEIFDTIRERLKIYFKKPEKNTCIDFKLSVVNAVSKRYIIDTFKLLEQIHSRGSAMEINWFYQKDNDDIKEFGEICKSHFKINIHLKVTHS
jgi:hypothetical protein